MPSRFNLMKALRPVIPGTVASLIHKHCDLFFNRLSIVWLKQKIRTFPVLFFLSVSFDLFSDHCEASTIIIAPDTSTYKCVQISRRCSNELPSHSWLMTLTQLSTQTSREAVSWHSSPALIKYLLPRSAQTLKTSSQLTYPQACSVNMFLCSRSDFNDSLLDVPILIMFTSVINTCIYSLPALSMSFVFCVWTCFSSGYLPLIHLPHPHKTDSRLYAHQFW